MYEIVEFIAIIQRLIDIFKVNFLLKASVLMFLFLFFFFTGNYRVLKLQNILLSEAVWRRNFMEIRSTVANLSYLYLFLTNLTLPPPKKKNSTCYFFSHTGWWGGGGVGVKLYFYSPNVPWESWDKPRSWCPRLWLSCPCCRWPRDVLHQTSHSEPCTWW